MLFREITLTVILFLAAQSVSAQSFVLLDVDSIGLTLSAVIEQMYQNLVLGEATHGTREYYTWRRHITKRLIKEKNSILLHLPPDNKTGFYGLDVYC